MCVCVCVCACVRVCVCVRVTGKQGDNAANDVSSVSDISRTTAISVRVAQDTVCSSMTASTRSLDDN